MPKKAQSGGGRGLLHRVFDKVDCQATKKRIKMKHALPHKKLLIPLFLLILFLSLASCSKNVPDITSTGEAASSAANNVAAHEVPNISNSALPTAGTDGQATSLSDTTGTETQSFTFQVNSIMPVYQCVATIDAGVNWCGTTTQITITEMDNNKLIQTIVPPAGNEEATTSAAYFVDVTFDGNLDILIPQEHSAHYITFNAYIWDNAAQQFIEDPSFQDIWNPAIDSANKQILARDTNSEITSYVITKYEDGQFVATDSLGWQPADLDIDQVPNAENLIHLREIRSGITVVDTYVASSGQGSIGFDKNDPQVQSYLAPGSYWDLNNNSKWQCTFQGDLKPW